MARDHINYPDTFTEHYQEQHISDVKRIIDWLNESKCRTQSHLAKQIRFSTGYLSTLISGSHPKDPSNIIAEILPIIEDKPETVIPGGFVPTSTYTIVNIACKRAKESHRFTVIAGSPGVGKTTSLLKFVEDIPQTIYICGSEFTTASVVLDELIAALNIRVATSNTKASKAKLIIDTLKGSNRLIILDEADKCAKDACDPLRTISEATGCGVVLAGNHQLRHNILAGNNRFDLINDRVVFWPAAINHISLEDCNALMTPYLADLQLADDKDTLVKYAYHITKGSARKLVNSLIPNMLNLYKSKIDANQTAAVSCVWLQSIAKIWMGISNPPALPQQTKAVPIA